MQVLGGTPLYFTGNMRDPQMYMVAICFLSAAVGSVPAGRGQWALRAALALTTTGLVLHFKRGVWLASALAVTIMAVVGRKKVLAGALLVALAAVLCLPQVRDRLAPALADLLAELLAVLR